MATAVIEGRSCGPVCAQSIDIARVLKEETEPEVPLLRLHPWQWVRDRLAATGGKPVASANRDQLAMELFYRLQLVDGIQISPDVQLIVDPALQPSRDFVAVFGLRSRLVL
jgi:hypothetical protein